MTLWVAGCAGAGASQPQLRPGLTIGVVEPQRILNETEAGKKAMESLAAFTKSRQSLIEAEEQDLRRMEEELVRQASVLSANAKREREEQFRRRMVEYQQKVNEVNREVQEKQRETLEAFRERVERVVARLAQQMGLVIVVEKGRGSQTVYSDASLDITSRVIEAFNKEAQ
jgi:outer membrane protein